MSTRSSLIALLLAGTPLLGLAQPACVLNVSFTFTESAPRDLFEVRNDSSRNQQIRRLRLDLDGSMGRLIFDTEEGPPGVNVFQPFRVESGDARLITVPVVQDGSDHLELDFQQFEPGQRFQFSIDVDDRLGDSDLGQIRISGRELEGSLLTVVVGVPNGADREIQARVDGANRARVQTNCS